MSGPMRIRCPRCGRAFKNAGTANVHITTAKCTADAR